MPAPTLKIVQDPLYVNSVHRFDEFGTFLIYTIRLENCPPPIANPLLLDDPAVAVDLQSIFNRCYDARPCAREIFCGEDVMVPPLAPQHTTWAGQVLQSKPGCFSRG